MPPRTTRKSYRPRVSDRTMIGTLRPHCLFASETEGRRHANEMNLRNRENHGSSLQHMGWMAGRISPLPPVEGEAFFLTSPFIERACRERSIGGEKPTSMIGLCQEGKSSPDALRRSAGVNSF